MPEPTPTPTPSPTPTPTPSPPWHAGIDAELVGWGQNKGWKIDDPKEAFAAAAKQAYEAEKAFSIPPNQVLKIPQANAKPEDVKAFWNRLGAPSDPKEYDLASVKYAGEDLEPAFADAMRNALASAFVPKDRATGIVKSVVEYLENADKAETSITNGKIAEEKASLQKNWGQNFDYNHLKAIEGARRLGITPEAVKALEGQIGYAQTMEAFRKIGAGTTEDMFVDSVRGSGANGVAVTREGAIARKAELERDAAWVKRYLAGGTEEGREMLTLMQQIDGVA